MAAGRLEIKSNECFNFYMQRTTVLSTARGKLSYGDISTNDAQTFAVYASVSQKGSPKQVAVVFDSLAPWIEAMQSTEAALLSTGRGGERHYTSLDDGVILPPLLGGIYSTA
ncbi:hypothetical protein AB3S75_011156 [Citrus x aurantiifolia]